MRAHRIIKSVLGPYIKKNSAVYAHGGDYFEKQTCQAH